MYRPIKEQAVAVLMMRVGARCLLLNTPTPTAPSNAPVCAAMGPVIPFRVPWPCVWWEYSRFFVKSSLHPGRVVVVVVVMVMKSA